MKRISKYFIRGLIYLAPISVTIYTLHYIITKLDGIVESKIPGVSIALVLMSITILGFIGSLVISSPIVSFLEKLLIKIPLVNILYTSTKDLVHAFAGEKNKFTVPVMVQFDPKMELYKPGFVTNENLDQIDMAGKVAVYLPLSYAFSGNVFIVPIENVQKVDVPAVDYMKFIVSGGVSGLNK